jgi:uncharacterized protein
MAKKTRAKKISARRAPAKKPLARKKTGPSPKRTPSNELNGWITHTEFASSDPGAMKTWLTKVLGWKFRPSFPMPDGGEYLLYMYSDKGGGGIRSVNQSEEASTVPYVQVANVQTSFTKAIREGGEEIMAPERIMEDLVIAVVRAPGGVMIGLAGPK